MREAVNIVISPTEKLKNMKLAILFQFYKNLWGRNQLFILTGNLTSISYEDFG